MLWGVDVCRVIEMNLTSIMNGPSRLVSELTAEVRPLVLKSF